MSDLVLVVDDDEHVRDALAMLLELDGFMVAKAADGFHALAMLRAGLRPAVVLLDLMMPRMSGQDLVSAIRADPVLAGLSLVVLTGDRAGEHTAESIGADAYLKKPVEMDAVLGTVRGLAG